MEIDEDNGKETSEEEKEKKGLPKGESHAELKRLKKVLEVNLLSLVKAKLREKERKENKLRRNSQETGRTTGK